MDKDAFRRARVALDLSITEAAAVLGVSEASVTAWQSGRYRVPGWVDERLKEMRAVQNASKAERCVRRAIEDKFAHLTTRLSLGEVPDGWLALVEAFLQECDSKLPDAFKGTDALDFGFKEKWGSLRSNLFLDCAADLEGGAAFWEWMDTRCEQLEADSEKLCARCGSDDGVSMTTSGWRLPLCSRHKLIESEGK